MWSSLRVIVPLPSWSMASKVPLIETIGLPKSRLFRLLTTLSSWDIANRFCSESEETAARGDWRATLTPFTWSSGAFVS